MNARCHYPKDVGFRYYGQRGITVCAEWRTGPRGSGGFERFLAYMGPRPEGTTIDRVQTDGNYEPGNVRWAPNSLQVLNKRLEKRRVPLEVSLAWCRAAHAHNGKIWGPGASEWLQRSIRADLIAEFGPERPAQLSDFCLTVEQAYWERDYGHESFHYEGLDQIYRVMNPHWKPIKQPPYKRKRGPHKTAACKECGSIAHKKPRCPVIKKRERSAENRLDRELKQAERARAAEQRRVDAEAKRIQREYSKGRAA